MLNFLKYAVQKALDQLASFYMSNSLYITPIIFYAPEIPYNLQFIIMLNYSFLLTNSILYEYIFLPFCPVGKILIHSRNSIAVFTAKMFLNFLIFLSDLSSMFYKRYIISFGHFYCFYQLLKKCLSLFLDLNVSKLEVGIEFLSSYPQPSKFTCTWYMLISNLLNEAIAI